MNVFLTKSKKVDFLPAKSGQSKRVLSNLYSRFLTVPAGRQQYFSNASCYFDLIFSKHLDLTLFGAFVVDFGGGRNYVTLCFPRFQTRAHFGAPNLLKTS